VRRLPTTNRLTGFVLVLALLSGLAASWLWAERLRGAQQQERDDLNLFLDASSAGWAEVSDQFFTVPESAAQSVAGLAAEMDSIDERIVLLTETIRTSSIINAAFIGYPNGEFLFVGRSDDVAVGGFRTRQITLDQGERQVLLTWTDTDRRELQRELDPADSYDPRERPWYLDQSSATATFWTAPYIFSSSQQPGITYSRLVVGPGGIADGVVGIDVRLTDLGGFLDQLAPGLNGDAAVLDAAGNVIAVSTDHADATGQAEGQILLTAETDKIVRDAILRVKSGQVVLARDASYDGSRTMVTRAVREPDDWYLAVQATDSDFLGDFSQGTTKNALGISLIGLATAVLVGALGFWVLRYRNALMAEAELDELTGLLSRRAVRRSLDSHLGKRSAIDVAIIDLDNFKAVNDVHGHIMGDKVLTAMAQRIEGFAVEGNAAAGRLGGDEFAVIAPQHTDWNDLAHELRRPLHIESLNFDVGASIGVVRIEGDCELTAEDVLRTADRALFKVKRSGGGRADVADGSVLV